MNLFKIFQSKKEKNLTIKNYLTNKIDSRQIAKTLEKAIDPESGINIVDLGLIYAINISDSQIFIAMSMTTPSCPMVGLLSDIAKENIEMLNIKQTVEIEIVWEPKWCVEMMSETAKKQLGW